MLSPHKDFLGFFSYIAKGPGTVFSSWSGDVFRTTLPQWASQPYRLTGAGALLAGGRWNVLRLHPAIYFSTSAKTVAAEADAKAIRYGWSAASLQPQTRIVFKVHFHRMLDLTNYGTVRALGMRKYHLTHTDWEKEQTSGREALTQAIARAVFENEGEGLIVPSARDPGGVNVVFFPAHRQPSSTIETYDAVNIPFMHGLR